MLHIVASVMPNVIDVLFMWSFNSYQLYIIRCVVSALDLFVWRRCALGANPVTPRKSELHCTQLLFVIPFQVSVKPTQHFYFHFVGEDMSCVGINDAFEFIFLFIERVYRVELFLKCAHTA